MNRRVIKTTFISIIAFGVVAMTSTTFAKKAEPTEKCMGIAKVGKGDGIATVDGKKEEWIIVPAEACEKLVGGRVYIEK